jgi:predicted Zn-dependent protease
MTRRRGRLAAVVLTGLLLGGGCFRNPVTHRREAKLISEEAERQIGRETRRKLVEEYGEMKDPVLREYVSALGKKIAAVSDRPRLDFEFTILDAEMVNAFAAPGGFIFVTRGLLGEIGSEAELATVLGHEIGHVCAWHSINMIEKQMGYGALATLGAIVSGIQLGPEAMIMVAQTADLFTSLYLLGYSREYELEADRVGLRYAISAGYNPEAALAFFERLLTLEKQEGGDKWEPFFRSHPPTEDRVVQAKRYIGRMNVASRRLEEGLETYREMKDRLPSLPPEERGYFEGQTFRHPPSGAVLTLPSGWKWESSSRTALAAFREERGGGWGELRRQAVGRNTEARQLADLTVAEKRWHPIQGREVLYPSGYGYLGQYYGSGVLGGLYQMRVLFTVRDRTGYILICAAPPERIANYLISFEQILRSFRLD